MTTRKTSEILAATNEIVAPPPERACTDQSFELPSRIYVAMALMFFGFIGVLGLAFHGGYMGVVYAVVIAFIAMFFAIPAMFPGMAGSREAMSWSAFRYRGIETATGHSTARETTILVLALPFLILCFGIAVALISALVS